MALIYDEVMAKVETDLPFSYTDKDAMFYALSVGMGSDPLDDRELPFVYEQGVPLRTVPTLATVLVPEMFPVGLGWDYTQILHGEQQFEYLEPACAGDTLTYVTRVTDIFDKKGGVLDFVVQETVITNQHDARVANLRRVFVIRN